MIIRKSGAKRRKERCRDGRGKEEKINGEIFWFKKEVEEIKRK